MFGLSLYTTEREVRDAFEKYGRVGDCRIVHDHAVRGSLYYPLIYSLQYILFLFDN